MPDAPKKLTVTFRVEPGCLGPEGSKHVAPFCQAALLELGKVHDHFIDWEVVPRLDKATPEMDYSIQGKRLTREQASRYLTLFDQDIDAFEAVIFDALPVLIDDFFGR